MLLRNSKVSTNIVVLSHGDSRDVLPKCPSAAQHTPDELNEQPTPTTEAALAQGLLSLQWAVVFVSGGKQDVGMEFKYMVNGLDCFYAKNHCIKCSLLRLSWPFGDPISKHAISARS